MKPRLQTSMKGHTLQITERASNKRALREEGELHLQLKLMWPEAPKTQQQSRKSRQSKTLSSSAVLGGQNSRRRHHPFSPRTQSSGLEITADQDHKGGWCITDTGLFGISKTQTRSEGMQFSFLKDQDTPTRSAKQTPKNTRRHHYTSATKPRNPSLATNNQPKSSHLPRRKTRLMRKQKRKGRGRTLSWWLQRT